MSRQLREIAGVLRSKNAGPFIVTIDVMLNNEADFELVKRSNVLNKENVAKAYGVPENEVIGPFYDRGALGAKVSVPKLVSAQDPFCPDLFGCNAHLPIASLLVEDPV